MTTEKMFEFATRNKLRFPFRGNISVEDLWDLSPENLDLVFRSLNSQKKKVNEESLLTTPSNDDAELSIMIDIIRYIVSVKLEERDARDKARTKKEQKQKILEIIDAKRNEDLQNKSIDELTAMLNELAD